MMVAAINALKSIRFVSIARPRNRAASEHRGDSFRAGEWYEWSEWLSTDAALGSLKVLGSTSQGPQLTATSQGPQSRPSCRGRVNELKTGKQFNDFD